MAAWASLPKVILGCLAFLVWWVLAVFPAVPFLPIGRTAGSILGATLMVVFQVISPDHAFAAVDLPILGLLFGTMLISVYLKRARLFEYLGRALSWKTRGGKDLLCRVCLLSALSSALFTNDTTCVVLTGFVLELCRSENLDPKPFLMALASSSNIGSAATPIGNPQNLVIAVNSGISFGLFLSGVLPAMAVGLVVNTLLLLAVYGRSLSLAPGDSTISASPSQQTELQGGTGRVELGMNGDSSGDVEARRPSKQASLELSDIRLDSIRGPGGHTQDARDDTLEDSLERGEYTRSERDIIASSVASNQGVEHAVTSASSREALSTAVLCDNLEAHSSVVRVHKKRGLAKGCALFVRVFCGRKGADMLERRWRKQQARIWNAFVYLVTIGMLAALLAGLSLPWTAITAAVVLTMLDFSDAGPNLDKVSYALLVFFSGMFIATSGFNATGAPEAFWEAVQPHSRIDTVSGVSMLSVVVTVLSNVVSNVPTVILLGPRVAASAADTPGASAVKAWLILAWVSTVAGNLTLVGSAANLIVCEQARPTAADKVLSEGQSNGLQRFDRPTYDLTFMSHLKFGFPSTIIVTIVGLVPLVIRKF